MDNETRERIIEDSKNWTDCNPINAYIAGAFAEHSRITELLKEERVKAIDEVVKLVFEDDGDFKQNESPDYVMRKIQSLKGKQQ